MTKDRASNSPILFLGISKAYVRAYEVLWDSEFAARNRFHWDLALLFHPISHLLGVSLETAMKGLISCRKGNVPHTHDLESLLGRVSDQELLTSLDSALVGLAVPEELLEANPDTSRAEIESFYWRHYFHFEMLNKLYNHPYATRYPVLGGHVLPDPVALHRMTVVLQDRLVTETRKWHPDLGVK